MPLLLQDRAKARRPGNGRPPRLLPHILIVEDDPTLREILALRFARAYRVLQAACGEEALRLLGSGPVHLILLDNRLPDGNGLDLLPTLKQRWPSIPILFITAYPSEEVAVEAFRRGARDYLAKPFDLGDLERRIEWSLEACRRARERRRPLPYACSNRSASGPRPPGFPPAGLSLAVEHLRTHYTEETTLGQLSRLAGMERHALSRTFKETLGRSWKACCAEFRIRRACHLLRCSRLTVTEIVQRVGYGDLTHFERVFKRHTGLTPRAYRKVQRPPSR